MHATLRAARDVRGLRGGVVFPAVRDALRAASRSSFRVVHFSVQGDHVHLVVEAADKDALSSGMRGLAIRVARAINRALGRKGQVWGDRYHLQPLSSPRQVRNTLLYVLANFRKHFRVAPGPALDPCSSARWFDGWSRPLPAPSSPPPTAAPRTWLLTVGWRRAGLLSPGEAPAAR